MDGIHKKRNGISPELKARLPDGMPKAAWFVEMQNFASLRFAIEFIIHPISRIIIDVCFNRLKRLFVSNDVIIET